MGGGGKGGKGRRPAWGGFNKNARGGDRRGAKGSRHDRQEHAGYNGRGDEEEEVDAEEVCRSIENLPHLKKGEQEKACSKMFSSMFSNDQKMDSLLASFPPESEEMQRLQSALEAALPHFSQVDRSRIRSRLSQHGFELENAGSSAGGGEHRKVTLRKGGGFGAAMLRGMGAQSRSRLDEPLEAEEAWVPKSGGFGRKKGGGQGKQPKAKAAPKQGVKTNMKQGAGKKQKWQEERGRGAGRGKTGANCIEVEWKPPEGSEAAKELEAAKVKTSPSPVRAGPAGRGRGTAMPAWMMKAQAEPAPPSIPDGKDDGERAAPPSSEPPNPSIPQDEPDLLASFHDERAEGDWQASQGSRKNGNRKSAGGKGDNKGKGAGGKAAGRKGKASRSRSGGKGGRKGKPSRSRSGGAWRHSGLTPNRGSHEDAPARRDSWGGNSSWNDQDDNKDWNSKWDWSSWQGSSWNGQEQSPPPPPPRRHSPPPPRRQSSPRGRRQEGRRSPPPLPRKESNGLFCSLHNKKRGWASLTESSGEWICRPDFECIVHIGGSKDFATAPDRAVSLRDSSPPRRASASRSPPPPRMSRSPPPPRADSRDRRHHVGDRPVGVTDRKSVV